MGSMLLNCVVWEEGTITRLIQGGWEKEFCFRVLSSGTVLTSKGSFPKAANVRELFRWQLGFFFFFF